VGPQGELPLHLPKGGLFFYEGTQETKGRKRLDLQKVLLKISGRGLWKGGTFLSKIKMVGKEENFMTFMFRGGEDPQGGKKTQSWGGERGFL